MKQQEIFNVLLEAFGKEAILEYAVTGGEEEKDQRDPFILVKTESLPEICRFLKDDERTGFDMLHCVSGVDCPDYLESVYHLYSIQKRHWAILKVRVSKSDPTVPTLTSVWPAANWLERETYDLMGIVFEGHPDPRRILLAEEWEGHPLRKDYEMLEHERLRELGF